MEPQINEAQNVIEPLTKVTPLSKYLAMALFIILPFVGGYIGYMYAPEKVVEVVKEVEVGGIVEVPQSTQSEIVTYSLRANYKPPLDEGSFGIGSIVLVSNESELELYSQPVANESGCVISESPLSDFLFEKMNSLVGQKDDVISFARCSITGSGALLALYNDGGNKKILRLSEESCEAVVDCEPYKKPEIIWQQ
jgi:hypothetical protein